MSHALCVKHEDTGWALVHSSQVSLFAPLLREMEFCRALDPKLGSFSAFWACNTEAVHSFSQFCRIVDGWSSSVCNNTAKWSFTCVRGHVFSSCGDKQSCFLLREATFFLRTELLSTGIMENKTRSVHMRTKTDYLCDQQYSPISPIFTLPGKYKYIAFPFLLLHCLLWLRIVLDLNWKNNLLNLPPFKGASTCLI